MGAWFDESDSERTIKNHISDKNCPHSIWRDAKRELKERGYTDEEIFEIECNEDHVY